MEVTAAVCTRCKRAATPNYKTCETCRANNKKSHEKQKLADPTGYREKCNESDKKSRKKRMREDPDAVKASANARNKKWRDVHKTDIREKDRNSVTRHLGKLKYAADDRDYEWAIDDDDAKTMILGLCFYCGIKADDRVGSIDRMDNSRGYFADNTVGCCGVCNSMKKCVDARTFVDRCLHRKGLVDNEALWPDRHPSRLSMYRSNAKDKKLDFELTKEKYDNLINEPCVFCRRKITATNKSGIDRIDNGRGYVEGNMQSCCSECNYSRGDLTVEAFLEKISLIAARAEMLLIPEMPVCLRSITPRTRNKPGRAAPTKKQRAR